MHIVMGTCPVLAKSVAEAATSVIPDLGLACGLGSLIVMLSRVMRVARELVLLLYPFFCSSFMCW